MIPVRPRRRRAGSVSGRSAQAAALVRPVAQSQGRRLEIKAPMTLADTIAAMNREVIAGSSAPIVREAARGWSGGRAWWDWWPQLCSLKRQLRLRVPFVPDPAHVETIQTAEFTLAHPTAGGDCDDLTIAGNALAESIGFETRIGLAGGVDGPAHVFGLVRFPGFGRWVPVDWGGDAPCGEFPSWSRVWLPEGVDDAAIALLV